MRIKNFIYIIVITILIVIQSCCSKEDLANIDYGDFIFKDKSNGENLFFGLNSKLNKDSIFISYIDTNNFQRLNFSSNTFDSVIPIHFNETNKLFIKFSDGDIDTFVVNYEKVSAKTSFGQCKLTASVIKDIQYNNVFLNTSNLLKPIIINK